ncbi:hypothetical protein M948_15475 [Virgibacillus sp. CM-4]|uniref:DNA-processing protein DprA n=1 Tax=Virgibacillus sp. CM-4 TaxID=1354277 RepID=UPI00038894DC|nr:DNA-processing protein DprA [Virgibacillus sp. CM-4]EQB36430.1 hypothetical protein M948_15475 [Virgibacillus sp. CM-4]
MNDQQIRLLHLSRCRGVSRAWLRKWWDDLCLTELYHLTPQQICHDFQMPLKNAIVLQNDLHHYPLLRQIEKDIANYQVITILDDNYPPMLKAIKDAPLVLYASGNLSLINQLPLLSVIGTRLPSGEAMKKVIKILHPLLLQEWVIVSGMAKGIDSYAHEVTLNKNGYTIAVLGGGFHHIYPKENTSLFQQISNRGLVLSEYAPESPPAKYHFLERNRIISGLSFGTLVIEAKEKSGTLITVEQALDQGREVFAVPGSPLSLQSTGCHKMIQDGAKLVTKAQDIYEEWETMKHAYV